MPCILSVAVLAGKLLLFGAAVDIHSPPRAGSPGFPRKSSNHKECEISGRVPSSRRAKSANSLSRKNNENSLDVRRRAVSALLAVGMNRTRKLWPALV